VQIGTRTAHKAREDRDLSDPSLPWETGGNYLVVSRKLNNRYHFCGLHIYMKKADNPWPGGNKLRNSRNLPPPVKSEPTLPILVDPPQSCMF
jgi:hypothetical protein